MSASTSTQFSRAADSYNDEAIIQRQTAELLMTALPATHPTHTLEIGCGTGLLTRLLAKQFPEGIITAIDSAPGMISYCDNTHQDLTNVDWQFCSIENWSPLSPNDLTISNAALHWALPLNTALSAIHGSLHPGGQFRAVLMIAGTLNELHTSRTVVVPKLPPQETFHTTDSLTAALNSSPLEILSIDTHTLVSEFASARELLRSLRAQGLTGGPLSHGDRLLTRGELEEITAYYDRTYALPNGNIPATYEVALVAATRS